MTKGLEPASSPPTKGDTPDTLRDALERIADLEEQLGHAHADSGLLRLQLDLVSATDPVTGLANDNGVLAALEQAAVRAVFSGERFGILAIDIPEFAEIARTHGSEGLDAGLLHLGALVSACVRRVDTVGRIDELGLVAVMPMVDDDVVSDLIEAIEAVLLSSDIEPAGQGPRVSAQFGAVVSHADAPGDALRMLRQLTTAREEARPGKPVVVSMPAALA